MTRQQAAALRQLPPCKGSLQQQVHGAEQRCPSWGLTKLQRSHYQQHQLQQDVFGSGLAGEHWRGCGAGTARPFCALLASSNVHLK